MKKHDLRDGITDEVLLDMYLHRIKENNEWIKAMAGTLDVKTLGRAPNHFYIMHIRKLREKIKKEKMKNEEIQSSYER